MQKLISKKKFQANKLCSFSKNYGKSRDIKLVTNKGGRNYLVSKQNYHTTNFI